MQQGLTRPTGTIGRLAGLMPYLLLGVAVAWTSVRAAAPLHDPDSWFHLRLGEHFLTGRTLAPPESWSPFATADWVPTQPLPEIAAALLNRWFGLPALVWLYVATVVVLVLVVFLLARGQASPLPASVATLLFVAAGQNAFTPRPQMVSYLMLAVVVAAWLRTDHDLRPRWWLIPLAWLWSLCHGFWFIGVGYGYLFVIALLLSRRTSLSQTMRLAIVPVASTLVVLLNPVGPGVFAAPFAVNERGRYISEWQHADLLTGPGLVVLVMIVVTAAIWALKRSGATAFRILLLVSALFWAWFAVRTVTLAAIVAAPLLAAALESLLPTEVRHSVDASRERRVLTLSATSLLLAFALVLPFTAKHPGGVPSAMNPSLDGLPAGTRILNEYTLGGWLAWRHPDLERYVDGLADAYPVAHLEDTWDLVSLHDGWQAKVDDAQADLALLARDAPLTEALEDAGWEILLTDGDWVLLSAPD